MNALSSAIRHWPVAVFSGLTVLLSFGACLLPLPREVVPLVMVCLPAVVASVLAASREGRVGLGALWASLSIRRIHLSWLLVALVLGFGLRLLMALAAVAFGLIPALQVRAGLPAGFVALAVILLLSATLEGVGWRGYALSRLLAQHNGLIAGLLVGLPWGIVHLALLLPGMPYEGVSALAMLLQITSLSVLMAWLYVASGRSVALTVLFHAAQSFFVILNDGLGPTEQAWLMAGVYGLAGVVLAVLPGSALRRDAIPPLPQSAPAPRG